MHKTINHPEFGPITLVKRATGSSIRLSVHPIRGIRISLPMFTKYSTAEKFLSQKEEWLRKVIEKQKKRVESTNVIYREGVTFRTIKRDIRFGVHETAASANIKVRIGEDFVEILYPAAANPPDIQPLIKEAITKYLRYEAKEVLPQRCAQLAAAHGFKYNRIFLKDNSSNWGSCSKLNNINLNIHLVRLGSELADFVILHELCHLRHRNHGADFHNLLNNLCNGREKELSKMLRKNTTRI